MEFRNFSAIFRSCFVVAIFWGISNATVPNWCHKPARVQYFAISASVDATDFELHDGIVLLCQVKGAKHPSQLFAVYDGEESLIEFRAGDVTFKMMSGNIFWIAVTPSHGDARHLKGRIRNFDDFVGFHRVVRQDPRFSPQKFTIRSLESYNHARAAAVVDLPSTLFTRPVALSQYSIDVDVVDDDESAFVIEDEFVEDEFIEDSGECEEDARESYLTFYPYEFRITRRPIHAQVILTRTDDERMYFVIRLDTPANAANFANYIGRFARPEPHGLLLPAALENFLNRRRDD